MQTSTATKLQNEEAKVSEALCLHCRLPVPGGLKDFCCAGCASVYKTITELGLTEFYNYQGENGKAVAFIPGEKSFDLLDNSEFLNRKLSAIEGDICQGTFYLSGIHCAGCVWLIESLPKVLSGVLMSRVNFSSGEITVRFDTARTSLRVISQFLDSLGYRLEATVNSENASSKEDKKDLYRLGVAAVCTMNAMMLAVSLWQGIVTGIEEEYASLFRWFSLVISLPAVFYSALPFYRAAFSALRLRRLHIDLPISIALLGAFLISVLNTAINREHVYFDSVTTVIFLLLLGRLVQKRALKRARMESKIAWSILPSTTRCLIDGKLEEMPIDTVDVGMKSVVLPHERVPIDGRVVEGESEIDLSVLTGETRLSPICPGDIVHAGALNGEGKIIVEILAAGQNTRVGRLLSKLDDYSQARAPILEFTEKVSGVFVIGVLILATLTFLLVAPGNLFEAVDRTLALLVVSCPCALGLATPLAFGISIARAAKHGILIKGTEAIERLCKTERVFLDKTGTLTEGRPTISDVWLSDNASNLPYRPAVFELACITPTHPVSQALRRWIQEGDLSTYHNQQHLGTGVIVFEKTSAIPGKGVLALDQNANEWRLGSVRWHEELGVILPKGISLSDTKVCLSKNGQAIGVFSLNDSLKSGAREFIAKLKEMSFSPTILSGDNKDVVKAVGNSLGVSESDCLGGLYPEEKAEILGEEKRFSLMIGDGVNDCAAMKAADISIGVRGGLEVGLDVSDLFLTDPKLSNMMLAITGSQRTMKTVWRNLLFSGLYNFFGSIGAVLGFVNPVVAAFLMPISSITVVVSTLMSRTFDDR